MIPDQFDVNKWLEDQKVLSKAWEKIKSMSEPIIPGIEDETVKLIASVIGKSELTASDINFTETSGTVYVHQDGVMLGMIHKGVFDRMLALGKKHGS